jgi:hypothetical protein
MLSNAKVSSLSSPLSLLSLLTRSLSPLPFSL